MQARVDPELDAALRQAAREKRVTVSQLIRNILNSTFDLVDDVVRDVRRLADSAKGRPVQLDRVYAWQEVRVHRDTACTRCGAALPRGKRALYGLQDDPGAPRCWLCRACGAQVA